MITIWFWTLLWAFPALAGAYDPIPRPDFLKTALHNAAGTCDVGAARSELRRLSSAKRKEQLDQLDGEGYTPLAYAAENGCLTVAKLLLEAGAAVDATHEYFKVRPLLRAAWQRHAEVIDYLLRHGAEVNSRSRLGDTPLTATISGTVFQRGPRGERDEAIKVLMEHRADVNLQGRNGWTPLMYAVFQGEPGLVRLLIRKGADISAKDDKGKSALDYARERGEQKVLDALGG